MICSAASPLSSTRSKRDSANRPIAWIDTVASTITVAKNSSSAIKRVYDERHAIAAIAIA